MIIFVISAVKRRQHRCYVACDNHGGAGVHTKSHLPRSVLVQAVWDVAGEGADAAPWLLRPRPGPGLDGCERHQSAADHAPAGCPSPAICQPLSHPPPHLSVNRRGTILTKGVPLQLGRLDQRLKCAKKTAAGTSQHANLPL